MPNRSTVRPITFALAALFVVGSASLAALSGPASTANAARVKPTLNADFHAYCTNVGPNNTRLVVGINCRTMTFDGVPRRYIVEVPAGVRPGASPVVFVFHGTSGNGGEFSRRPRSGWSAIAAREKAVIVYPTALLVCALNRGVVDTPGVQECRTGKGKVFTRWSSYFTSRLLDLDARLPGYTGAWPPNDLGFFDAMVADLPASGITPADPGLFVAGFSSGGCMATTIAYERSATVDAASVVAGCGPESLTAPARYIPMEYRIGSNDSQVAESFGVAVPLPFDPAGFLSGIGAQLVIPMASKSGLDTGVVQSGYYASSLAGSVATPAVTPTSKLLVMHWGTAAAGVSNVKTVDVIVTKDVDHSYEDGIDQTPGRAAWQFFTRTT